MEGGLLGGVEHPPQLHPPHSPCAVPESREEAGILSGDKSQ